MVISRISYSTGSVWNPLARISSKRCMRVYVHTPTSVSRTYAHLSLPLYLSHWQRYVDLLQTSIREDGKKRLPPADRLKLFIVQNYTLKTLVPATQVLCKYTVTHSLSLALDRLLISLSRARVRVRVRTISLTHARARARTHTRTHTHTHTRTHTHTHAHTLTFTHTHTHAHLNTQTETCKNLFS